MPKSLNLDSKPEVLLKAWKLKTFSYTVRQTQAKMPSHFQDYECYQTKVIKVHCKRPAATAYKDGNSKLPRVGIRTKEEPSTGRDSIIQLSCNQIGMEYHGYQTQRFKSILQTHNRI